ncbi:DUF1294 domain-containing protein [Luteimonas sp. FCS-9]|uniref:DUF1294 domain-containing protein n=1 Tax=Luteimonas sp. FCS-9 TaxID=1547516 RepID=UPI00063EC3CF|nr:DUF1294 domain-containing protein [Luteimonas sp. FCS-9]KLI98836.1 hypothetical protein WQ56_13905 [Luteimonas sp. FCS-9]
MSEVTQPGRIANWDDARGYGFVEPLDPADGPRAFFHIRDYDQGGRRPEVGEVVRYTRSRQADGRWRARQVVRVSLAAARTRQARHAPIPARAPGRGGLLAMSSLIAAWAAALAWGLATGRLPVALAPALAVLNLVTFAAYAIDKRAAQAGRRRTPEARLHLFELLGGWPAAWLGQRLLRHKSAKPGYRVAFRAMVALHLLAFALVLSTAR